MKNFMGSKYLLLVNLTVLFATSLKLCALSLVEKKIFFTVLHLTVVRGVLFISLRGEKKIVCPGPFLCKKIICL